MSCQCDRPTHRPCTSTIDRQSIFRLQEDPGKGTLPGVVGWVLRHRRALTITYLVRQHLALPMHHARARLGCDALSCVSGII